MECVEKYRLLVHSARQLVQVVRNGERVVKGEAMNRLAVIEATEHEGISVVVRGNGTIVDIDHDNNIREKYQGAVYDHVIDASGMCVLPGLVDAHTHPVWAGDRVHEFAMKLAGATYMEVHNAGGGIHFTVDHTRRASKDLLLTLLLERLNRMMRCGTTLMEAKTGYGLDAENEAKLLRVLERAKLRSPVEISTTFCGAHAVPKGLTSEAATTAVLEQQLPKVKEMMDAGEVTVDSIDVFCEKGVFDVDQSSRILQEGKKIGLKLNFHGDELSHLGAAEMGAQLGAEAISHLEEVGEEGLAAMAKAGTVAVVLPTTAYILRLRPPPVRKMIEAEIPVALGTDFNPNAFCLSMPVAMHMACVQFHMSMPEALVASTINAAASIGRSKTHGSLEKGKVADMLVINAPRWEHLVYQMAGHDHLIKHVIKRGNVVHSSS